MNNQEFKDFIGNKIFSVDFVKKNGDKRTYNAKVNVRKHTRGGKNNVEHKPNLVTIFEMNSRQYRTLNLDSITELRCAGKTIQPIGI